ncbi:hypothetical protein P154DRAFT_41366 [Amniculicola lignicola CBS 123094]|uniref:Uncharacterized protein n=1 Tax=Amniculicola lignicola CBS 123094 TaxID=1392246 RepID=A0A6A5VZ98_9PLEO|nr:hypothetical protein P154DRAFT_41366 [Amniculicola lignicola CBS 123094]
MLNRIVTPRCKLFPALPFPSSSSSFFPSSHSSTSLPPSSSRLPLPLHQSLLHQSPKHPSPEPTRFSRLRYTTLRYAPIILLIPSHESGVYALLE